MTRRRTLPARVVLVVGSLALALAGSPGPAAGHEDSREGGREAGRQAPPAPARDPVFDFEAPVPGSYALPPIRPAPDGDVLDHAGRAQRLHALMAGRIVVLSFIYANCENECPAATAALFEVFHATGDDPALARNLKLISLSFDPGRDGPEAMAAYGYAALADPAGTSPWNFLTTRARPDLAPILAGFGQRVDLRPPGAGAPAGAIDHLLRVYLIDRRGLVRNVYDLAFLDPRLVLADVRSLLLEEAAGGR